MSPPELAKLLTNAVGRTNTPRRSISPSRWLRSASASASASGARRTGRPLEPRFFVTGEVEGPGAYPIGTGATVLQGIALAGGVQPFAAKRRIQVRRKVGGMEQIFVFDYESKETKQSLQKLICAAKRRRRGS